MKILIALTLILMSAVSQAATWIFETPYHAQQFKYSYNVEKREYSFRSNDVTVIVDSCESEKFEVCVISNYLDLVIPRKPLNVGDTWTHRGTQFEYVRLLPELRFWGNVQENLMVIRVIRDYQIYDGVDEKKFSTHIYSRASGLLYTVDDRDNVPLIATSLPSIGARPRE